MESKADWPWSCEHGSQGPNDTRKEFEGAARPPRDDAGGFGGCGADRPQLYQHDREREVRGVGRYDREDRCRFSARYRRDAPSGHRRERTGPARQIIPQGKAPLSQSTGLDVAARRARSDEHTSELQYLMRISYAVYCLRQHINNKP